MKYNTYKKKKTTATFHQWAPVTLATDTWGLLVHPLTNSLKSQSPIRANDRVLISAVLTI